MWVRETLRPRLGGNNVGVVGMVNRSLFKQDPLNIGASCTTMKDVVNRYDEPLRPG